MKVFILVGTRPNFIKVTQFKKIAADHYPHLDIRIIHTGQHYDKNMAGVFFEQFNLQPDHFLNIGQGTPNSQIAKIQLKLEELFEEIGKPDLFIVPGDVNSTLAGSICANKMGIPLAHLEAGLRSYDRNMPEEYNRLVTDELSDILFVTEPSGQENLEKEGKKGEIRYVGNTMIDTLVAFEQEIQASDILDQFKLEEGKFVVVTVHRPSNVDHQEKLQNLIHVLKEISKTHQIVLPVHPRTKKNLEKFGLSDEFNQIGLINPGPLGYFEFQKLIAKCTFVLTDSGGIQEETTFRQVPCLTVRNNTERPITTQIGTNTLKKLEYAEIMEDVQKILDGTYKKGEIPKYWDGQSTKRILESIV
ncbi:MAG: UDP-N-acetylglucosamine 2-epimerase (non-hydrolyzing) [Bacteroidota bacterium]